MLYGIIVCAVCLFVSIGTRAQIVASSGGSHSSDSAQHIVRYRDTLVESEYVIGQKPLRAGVEASYGWNDYYDASFPIHLDEPGCDLYSMGTGNDIGIRLLADIPLWGDNSPWSFRPSLFLQYQKPKFNWTESDSNYDPVTGKLGPFTIDHEIATTIGEAGIAAGFDYEFLNRWHAIGAARVGMIIHQSFQESLSRGEAGALFPDGTRDTITSAGTLPAKSFEIVPALSLGLGYDAPLSRTAWAEPGLNLMLPFGGLSSNGGVGWRLFGTSYWRDVQLNATFTILFDLTPRSVTVPIFVKQEIPDTYIVPPPVVSASPLTASIRAVAISSTGEKSDVAHMTVEEVRTRNADPILNYIFFDAGSSQFPARYIVYPNSETAQAEFPGSSERHDTKLMDLYRETMNILGDRMRKFPATRITLIGSTDNSDDRDSLHAASDAALLGLARGRAQAVKSYLVSIWHIDPARLSVEASLVPAKASPMETENGRAENRRVEFRAEGTDSVAFRLTEPVTVTNIEHLATPDRIRLQPSVSAPIVRSYASISAGGVILESFRTDTTSASQEKTWAPTEETLRNLHDSLAIDYDAWDSVGNHARAHSSIPLSVVHVTSDRPERIERFSLILFGFDEAQLSPPNGRSLATAAEAIRKIPIHRILIQGFTDEMGDPSHNDELSKARAEHVRTQFEQSLRDEGRSPDGMTIVSEGLGSRELPYDNSLPEGRFFSRTVTITIEREQ